MEYSIFQKFSPPKPFVVIRPQLLCIGSGLSLKKLDVDLELTHLELLPGKQEWYSQKLDSFIGWDDKQNFYLLYGTKGNVFDNL